MSYYLLTLLVLIISCLPLAIHYKRKKLRARELVLIALMSAIIVVANLITALSIPLHLGTSLVILSGIALGPEAGFLIGALSRFICNFFMGQGMWTPWQMLSWALLALIAGIAFSKVELIGHLDDKKKIKKENINKGLNYVIYPLALMIFSEILGYIVYLFYHKPGEKFLGIWLYAFGLLGLIIYIITSRHKIETNPITVAVFSFVTVVIIYGGIMNFASLITSATYMGGKEGSVFNLEALKLVYITGLPYDLSHGFTAAIMSFFLTDSFCQKIERIKRKYGIF